MALESGSNHLQICIGKKREGGGVEGEAEPKFVAVVFSPAGGGAAYHWHGF